MINISKIPHAITIATMLGLSALSGAANAGQDQQAIAAIALAKGKIESGDKIGANSQAPEIQSRARAALSTAETLLSNGKEKGAISAATDAGELADQAIFVADQQTTVVQREQLYNAQVAAGVAQKSAADANARAIHAEQSAAVSAAQTDMLRNMPPATPVVAAVVAPVAAPIAQPVVRHTITRRVVTRTTHRAIRKPAPVVTRKTTTTVTTTRP